MIFTAKDLDKNGALKTDATNVEVRDCAAIKTLTAPLAKKVVVWYCAAIKTITAPNATNVDVWKCPALTRITAPNATNVKVWYCAALKTLAAPKATNVEVGSCLALKTLDALLATEVYVWNCPKLTTLERSEKDLMEELKRDEGTTTLQERCEKAEEVLHRIREWCRAYPIENFPEPDFEADRKLLGDGEFTRLNAHTMRHVVTRITAIIDGAFAPEEREPNDT